MPNKLGQVNPIPIFPYNQEPVNGTTDTLYNYVMLLNYGRDVTDFDQALDYALPLIFNNYPIWDEDERSKLNRMIVVNFLNRPIAYETWGLFKLKLNNVMNIIMPKYNDLIHQYSLFNDKNILGLEDTENFNEIYNENHEDTGNYTTGVVTTDHQEQEGNQNSVQDSTTDTQSNQKDTQKSNTSEKFWDTPQQDLNQLEDKQYATNITQTDQSDNSTSEASGNTTQNSTDTQNTNQTQDSTGNSDTEHEYTDNKKEDHQIVNERTKYGNDGHSTQSLIREYQELVMSIYEKILNDDMLNNLFSFILYV